MEILFGAEVIGLLKLTLTGFIVKFGAEMDWGLS